MPDDKGTFRDGQRLLASELNTLAGTVHGTERLLRCVVEALAAEPGLAAPLRARIEIALSETPPGFEDNAYRSAFESVLVRVKDSIPTKN